MKKSPPKPRHHKDRPDDAVALAAFRCFAMDVERLLIRIYVTDRSQYARMMVLMRRLLGEIYKEGTSPELRRKAAAADAKLRKELAEENCPVGYELCADGLCAETCNVFGDLALAGK
jgi:hypothetical protein